MLLNFYFCLSVFKICLQCSCYCSITFFFSHSFFLRLEKINVLMDVYIKGVGSALKRIKLSMVKIGNQKGEKDYLLTYPFDGTKVLYTHLSSLSAGDLRHFSH